MLLKYDIFGQMGRVVKWNFNLLAPAFANTVRHFFAGYEETLARARKEFGVEASISSLKRYYYHVAPDRRIGEFANLDGTLENYRTAAKKQLAAAAFHAALSNYAEKDVKTLSAVMAVVLKQRQVELDQKRLAFEMARFELEIEKDG